MTAWSDIRDEVLSRALGNSRTAASGLIDTSSAPEKSARIGQTQSTQGAVASGTSSALDYLELVSVEDFVDEPARHIMMCNQLITSSPSETLLRDFESTRYPYLPARLIRRDLDLFSAWLQRHLENVASISDSCELASRVAWHVNLRGHYFADGCGRTSAILSDWLAWRTVHRLFPVASTSSLLPMVDSRGRPSYQIVRARVRAIYTQ